MGKPITHVKHRIKQVLSHDYVEIMRQCDYKIRHDPEYGTAILVELPYSETALLIEIPKVASNTEGEELTISFIEEEED